MAVTLHTAAEVRSLEHRLARDHGLDAATLMQRAGEALQRCIGAHWPEARRILILAGRGNNGGDGYVLARLWHAQGGRFQAQVAALADPASDPARAAFACWRGMRGETRPWQPGDALPQADLIVDALFGIGLSRPLDGAAAALVRAANDHGAPILAVDVPSGLDADSGHVSGAVIRATRTLCLLARKRGLYTGSAPDVRGALQFDDLGVAAFACGDAGVSCGANVGSDLDPVADAGTIAGAGSVAAAFNANDSANVAADVNAAGGAIVDGHTAADTRSSRACMLLEREDLRRLLPPRRRAAHKGHHGHVLVVGGDAGMSGAIRLAGEASMRAGAGWTSLATRAEHAGTVALHRPELMVHGVEDANALAPMLARADVVAAGPGMGQGDWARSMFDAVIASGMRAVLDADALNLLAASPRKLPDAAVLTPHPGEAARLLGCEVAAIERDRFAAARALAQRHRAVVVLKGAGTLVDDGERCAVCPFGNPGMATAGMGDVLTGIIAALLAQGLAPFDAATAGVLAHALAGDAAASDGERGLVAGDVIPRLRQIVNP
jgi:hydroxyethylthiazole kinase-like uncharacterized protein yjeF